MLAEEEGSRRRRIPSLFISAFECVGSASFVTPVAILSRFPSIRLDMCGGMQISEECVVLCKVRGGISLKLVDIIFHRGRGITIN